jgi:hypothetical protein
MPQKVLNMTLKENAQQGQDRNNGIGKTSCRRENMGRNCRGEA